MRMQTPVEWQAIRVLHHVPFLYLTVLNFWYQPEHSARNIADKEYTEYRERGGGRGMQGWTKWYEVLDEVLGEVLGDN